MTNKKPVVFNYREYEQALLDVERLTKENQELRDRLINAEIRIRILEGNRNGTEG